MTFSLVICNVSDDPSVILKNDDRIDGDLFIIHVIIMPDLKREDDPGVQLSNDSEFI